MKYTDARIYSGKTNFELKDLNLNSDGLLPIIVNALLAKVYQLGRVCDNALKSCFNNVIEEV